MLCSMQTLLRPDRTLRVSVSWERSRSLTIRGWASVLTSARALRDRERLSTDQASEYLWLSSSWATRSLRLSAVRMRCTALPVEPVVSESSLTEPSPHSASRNMISAARSTASADALGRSMTFGGLRERLAPLGAPADRPGLETLRAALLKLSRL